MRIQQLNDGACKTYLAENAGEAVLVDPLLGREDHYLAELKVHGLRLRYVLDTHTHADHLSACALLRDLTGADYGVHAGSPIKEANLRLDSDRDLPLGDTRVEILHTPGHTRDSQSFLLAGHLLTGDFLFLGEGGAGRTDLPGGDPGIHWDSLQMLEALDGSLKVLPGHDYRDSAPSTLAEERLRNPRLQPRSREAYVAWLQGVKMPAAGWMVDVVKANLRCTRDPACVAIPKEGASCEVGGGCVDIPTLTCQELADMARPPFLLDVREPDEFSGPLGHIDRAILIPLGDLPRRLTELEAHRHAPLITICQAGGRSAQAAKLLQEAGFGQVKSLTGGMGSWNILGLPVAR